MSSSVSPMARSAPIRSERAQQPHADAAGHGQPEHAGHRQHGVQGHPDPDQMGDVGEQDARPRWRARPTTGPSPARPGCRSSPTRDRCTTDSAPMTAAAMSAAFTTGRIRSRTGRPGAHPVPADVEDAERGRDLDRRGQRAQHDARPPVVSTRAAVMPATSRPTMSASLWAPPTRWRIVTGFEHRQGEGLGRISAEAARQRRDATGDEPDTDAAASSRSSTRSTSSWCTETLVSAPSIFMNSGP